MRSWTSALFVLALTAPLHAQERVNENCVTFESSGRLRRGASFRKGVSPGLEFRLTARKDGVPGWYISVGPVDEAEDYLWLVSPPLQTAPHLVVGPAYGLSAHESATLTPRRFRFVLTRVEYDRVRARIETAQITNAAELERMGRGTLLF
ncbi:MAG TPA: hypothetical protein VG106_03490, partial [Vicinamibacterales bacterium]|nr:hypothetical protein [Vicinamibacterales bacterium]